MCSYCWSSGRTYWNDRKNSFRTLDDLWNDDCRKKDGTREESGTADTNSGDCGKSPYIRYRYYQLKPYSSYDGSTRKCIRTDFGLKTFCSGIEEIRKDKA